VQTIHAAQGATAERVMAHMESFRAGSVDARAAYVALSRAKSHAALYTDSREALTRALGIRNHTPRAALDKDGGMEM
jgi:ATP-dependent exoDNAse (exonuclease V) alpha subunit